MSSIHTTTQIANWTIKGAVNALVRKAVRRGVDRDQLANLFVLAAQNLRTQPTRK